MRVGLPMQYLDIQEEARASFGDRTSTGIMRKPGVDTSPAVMREASEHMNLRTASEASAILATILRTRISCRSIRLRNWRNSMPFRIRIPPFGDSLLARLKSCLQIAKQSMAVIPAAALRVVEAAVAPLNSTVGWVGATHLLAFRIREEV